MPTVLVSSVGMSPQMSLIIGGCINMMFPIGSIIPSLALDRMGRRKTMIIGSILQSICMLMVAALLSQAGDPDTKEGKAFGAAATAFFFIFMFVFGASVNCVPWVYVPEILPLEARTRGTAIGVSSNWLWNFVIVMIAPIIVSRLKWTAYFIFMATNFLFVPFVYFFIPETSHMRLEDMDHFFSSGENPVVIARRYAAKVKCGEYDPEAELAAAGHQKNHEKAVADEKAVAGVVPTTSHSED
ncbi:MFS transporter [Candidatus Bathyarchaeota archaeon]|nr:MFS transporter [Candidatus Bathyarchaeota archaeon]